MDKCEFAVGDRVIIKQTNERGVIKRLRYSLVDTDRMIATVDIKTSYFGSRNIKVENLERIVVSKPFSGLFIVDSNDIVCADYVRKVV